MNINVAILENYQGSGRMQMRVELKLAGADSVVSVFISQAEAVELTRKLQGAVLKIQEHHRKSVQFDADSETYDFEPPF